MATDRGGNPRKKTPVKTRMTVSARATKMVEQLMGKAQAVLEEGLNQPQEVAVIDPLTGDVMRDSNGQMVTKNIGGDPRVAMYVIDRAWPKTGAVIPKAIEADLSTIDGVIRCAETCTQMLLRQEMSLEDARQLMDHLIRYCQLKAFERIDELKILVETFEAQNQGQLSGKMDASLLPSWGKLPQTIDAKTKTANKTPAE